MKRKVLAQKMERIKGREEMSYILKIRYNFTLGKVKPFIKDFDGVYKQI